MNDEAQISMSDRLIQVAMCKQERREEKLDSSIRKDVQSTITGLEKTYHRKREVF